MVPGGSGSTSLVPDLRTRREGVRKENSAWVSSGSFCSLLGHVLEVLLILRPDFHLLQVDPTGRH